MKMQKALALGIAAVIAISLAGCSSDDPSTDPNGSATGPVELTVSGWSLSTTPEFQVLADAFMAENQDIKVVIKEYDAADYETLMLTDMSAGTAPDIITIKQAKFTSLWVQGGQLLDVSDVVAGLGPEVSGSSSYVVDGASYAVAYRQDHWVLFYNKDLFDQAGVAYPDGTWTWDDYATAAKALSAALGQGVFGTYEHSWQSTLQGFANTQSPGANPSLVLNGEDYGYMKPYYERVLDLQASGAQESYANLTTNKLTYQGQFGKQFAAMLPMGSWYVATLTSQQASGDADGFAWGIAPIPQYDSSTTGLDKMPVTFGDPTGFAINKNIDSAKVDAAKKWLDFVASEKAGVELAKIGIVSSVSTSAVTEAYFAMPGIATDDLSKFAMSAHKTGPENPVSLNIQEIQSILNEAHSAIMSESGSVDSELAIARDKIKLILS
ncbi:MAG: extracellular solute-binding protein [Propionibacteriaceae bacterium]|jgi:multiple sugar transport system substrate-binding protein|nr:extracellular solute-binding protein [Propionibacteriaceae bacterium]